MKEHKWFILGLCLFTVASVVISYIVLRREYNDRDTNAKDLMNTITDEFRVTSSFILESFQPLLDTHSVIIGYIGKNVTSDFFSKLVASDLLVFSASIRNFGFSPIIYNDEREGHNDFGRRFINPNYTIKPINQIIDDAFLNKTYYLPFNLATSDALSSSFYGIDLTNTMESYGIDLTNMTGISTILDDLNNVNQFIITDGFRLATSIDQYDLGTYLTKLVTVGSCAVNSSVNFDTLIRANEQSRCINGISYIATLYRQLVSLTLSFYKPGPHRDVIESLIVFVTTFQNGHEHILYKPNTTTNYTVAELQDKYNIFYRSVNLTYGNRQLIFSLLFTNEVYNPSLVDKILITWIMLSVVYVFLLSIFMTLYYFIRKNAKLEHQKVEELYTLITYVNHELRNPLNVLLSLITISIRLIKNMLNSPDTPTTDALTDILVDILAKLETAHGSNHSVITIINDVSELKHIEQGKVTINMEVVSLEYIGTKTVSSLQHKLGENKYSISLEYTNTDPDFLIYTDPVRVNQILVNFITNAIIHSKSKMIHFNIYRENKKIYFKVVDTGVGIPMIIQPKIFKEKFIQSDMISQAIRIGGVGIGLYICYHLAKAIGAEVNFISNEESGTTFWLCIDEDKVKIPTDTVPNV